MYKLYFVECYHILLSIITRGGKGKKATPLPKWYQKINSIPLEKRCKRTAKFYVLLYSKKLSDRVDYRLTLDKTLKILLNKKEQTSSTPFLGWLFVYGEHSSITINS